MYKAPSFGLGMKKDLRESIESVYDINNTINEEEQLIISLFEEFLEENFHVEMLTEEDIDYILENEFPQWLEENEEYLTEGLLIPALYGAARVALPKILKFGQRTINPRKKRPQRELKPGKRPQRGWKPGELRRTLNRVDDAEASGRSLSEQENVYFPQDKVNTVIDILRSLFGLQKKEQKKIKKIEGSLKSDDRTKGFSQRGLGTRQGTKEARKSEQANQELEQAKKAAKKQNLILQQMQTDTKNKPTVVIRRWYDRMNPQPNPNFIKGIEKVLKDIGSNETPQTDTKNKPITPPKPVRVTNAMRKKQERAQVVDSPRQNAERNQPTPTTTTPAPKTDASSIKVRSRRTGGSELGRKLMEIGTKVRATSNTPEGRRKRELLKKYKGPEKKWSDSVFNNPDGN